MKIFIDATGVTPVATGLARYSLKLLENLTIAGDDRYTILCAPDLPESHGLFRLTGKNIRYLRRRIPVIGPWRDLRYGAVRGEIKRCDVYHCLSSYMPFFGAPIPSVVTVHDLKYIYYPEFLSSRFKAWYLRKVLMKTLETASRIIAVSQHTKKDLIALGAAKDKITVIHEASVIDFSGNPERENCGQFPWRDYLLFVGENRPHKNLDRLLLAYRSLVHDGGLDPPALVIAGNGTETLKERIVQLGIMEHTIVLGPVPDNELICLYRHALALVFPSLYEGFGLPVLEAMSAGVPVLTSRTTSTVEIAGEAAELVEPTSVSDILRGMKKLLSDDSWRQRLAQEGLAQAARFSWQKAARETLALYNQLP